MGTTVSSQHHCEAQRYLGSAIYEEARCCRKKCSAHNAFEQNTTQCLRNCVLEAPRLEYLIFVKGGSMFIKGARRDCAATCRGCRRGCGRDSWRRSCRCSRSSGGGLHAMLHQQLHCRCFVAPCHANRCFGQRALPTGLSHPQQLGVLWLLGMQSNSRNA